MQIHGKFSRILLPFALMLLVFSSCSDFRKIQRSDDVMKRYNAAVNYYESEKYSKAAILLEDILPLLRGKEEGERAKFLYAYSLFNQGLYIESAYYFQEFYQTYGRSEYAEEALFMHAYSLYLQSPRYNLDQTPSFEAIEALQNFINIYAYSEYRDRATEILDELQEKLALKAYTNAKLYLQLERFKAALVAFETFGNDFPDSDYNQEIAYLRIKAAYLLAKNSLQGVQEERYRDAIELYQEFIEDYPEGEYLKQAEDVYVDVQEGLEKLKENIGTEEIPQDSNS